MNPPVQSTAEQPVTEQSTGDARVDEQLVVLDQLSDRPVAEHVSILENVHRALGDVLATIDTDGGVADTNSTGDGQQTPASVSRG